MKKQAIAKAAAVTALMGLLLSGCKAQKPAEDGLKNPGAELQATEPSLPDKTTTGISLELPEDFMDLTGKPVAEKYDYLYTNGQMGISVTRLTKPENTSLEDYVNQDAGYYRAELTQKEGFWTISYEDLDFNEPQTMVNVYYESRDAFWTVQGYCPSQVFDQFEAQIWQYITSGVFAGD